VREAIAVTPDDLRVLAGRADGWSHELRGAAAGSGAESCWVAANLAGAAGSFDAMWRAWSVALDQLAFALEDHADALRRAAGAYEATDAASGRQLLVRP
jgi:WXG100 family type VII secretion target